MNSPPSGRLDDLLRPEVLKAFDREAFEQDGYWVWEGILSDAGRERFTESLKRLQRMNDRIVMDTDWAGIDFEGRGLTPPDPEHLGAEFLSACCGGSERAGYMGHDWRKYMNAFGILGPGPGLVTKGFESQGFMPEYFPQAYDEFLLDATTAHPQMRELLGKLFRSRYIVDHIIMLNRASGDRGRFWHAHQYRDGSHEVEDYIGTGAFLTTAFLEQVCIRTLCYPEGASEKDGGELAVIPGAHLYRIPFKWDGERSDSDEDMRSGWLSGKVHAVTRAPLEIVHLDLPPGSMVSFVHHMPHFVGSVPEGAATRWGILIAYRTPDPNAQPRKWSEQVPPHWADRQVAAGALNPEAIRVFQADNPA